MSLTVSYAAGAFEREISRREDTMALAEELAALGAEATAREVDQGYERPHATFAVADHNELVVMSTRPSTQRDLERRKG